MIMDYCMLQHCNEKLVLRLLNSIKGHFCAISSFWLIISKNDFKFSQNHDTFKKRECRACGWLNFLLQSIDFHNNWKINFDKKLITRIIECAQLRFCLDFNNPLFLLCSVFNNEPIIFCLTTKPSISIDAQHQNEKVLIVNKIFSHVKSLKLMYCVGLSCCIYIICSNFHIQPKLCMVRNRWIFFTN